MSEKNEQYKLNTAGLQSIHETKHVQKNLIKCSIDCCKRYCFTVLFEDEQLNCNPNLQQRTKHYCFKCFTMQHSRAYKRHCSAVRLFEGSKCKVPASNPSSTSSFSLTRATGLLSLMFISHSAGSCP